MSEGIVKILEDLCEASDDVVYADLHGSCGDAESAAKEFESKWNDAIKNLALSSNAGELAATQELLRLKELECEQLAKDKGELKSCLGELVNQFDDEFVNEYDYVVMREAKKLLEKLG